MQKILVSTLFLILVLSPSVRAQDKVVVVPKQIQGAPFSVEDDTDLFAKSYRFFIEGEVAMAADSLRKLIDMSGYKIDPQAYYIVVANFTDKVSPIGLFHEGSDFLDTFTGLKPTVFITCLSHAPKTRPRLCRYY